MTTLNFIFLAFLIPLTVTANTKPSTLHFNKLPPTSRRVANKPTIIKCYIYDETDSLEYFWEIKGTRYSASTIGPRYEISEINQPPRGSVRTTERVFGSQLKIGFLTIIDKGSYSCIAVNPKTKKSYKTSTNLIIILQSESVTPDYPSTNTPEYKCQPYAGQYCPSLSGMFIKVHQHQNQSDIENEVRRISGMFKLEAQNHPECMRHVTQATCYYIFDVCKPKEKMTPTDILKLCRQDCELLTHHNCRLPFQKFQQKLNSISISTLINCTKLADSSSQSPQHSQCLKTSLPSPVNATQKCYKTKLPGKIFDSMVHQSKAKTIYYGLASTTKTGEVCDQWNERKLLQNYPLELAGGHNYCRAINPAGLVRIKKADFDFNQPWCFVSNRKGEKIPQLCQIESCSPIIAGLTEYLPIILLVSAGLVLIFIITLVCCCCKCRNSNPNKKLSGDVSRLPDSHTVAGSFIHQPVNQSKMTHMLYHDDSSRSHSSQHLLNQGNTLNKPGSTYSSNSTLAEINPDTIERLCEIGDGNFGKVHLAKIIPTHPHYQPKQPVLVKTIDHETLGDETVEQEFIKELTNRAELRHANLICLKAYVKQQRICCLVYEYTEWSTLHKTLVASRLGVGAAGVPTHMSVANFPYIVRQVTDVMCYLEDKGYTHRDLAARNIMIMNNEFHVKIASLGMMRRDYMTDYAKLNWLQEMPFAMPLRWMAPESLQYGKFTIASDVFSFGIVLYEMFSFGNRPWAEFSNDQVIELVAHRGQTLHRPQDCPDVIYQIMKECWNTTPEHRPSFEQLKNKFMATDIFDVSMAMSQIGAPAASHIAASSIYSNQQQYRPAPNSPIGLTPQSPSYHQIDQMRDPLIQNSNSNNSNNSGRMPSGGTTQPSATGAHSGQRASSSYSDYSPKNGKQKQQQQALLSYHSMSEQNDNIHV